MRKVFITWEEVGTMIDYLVDEIVLSKKEFDGVYGVPRGGLPIAVALSHKLDLKLLNYPTENTLVVDDISDTGKTLASHKNKSIATIYTTEWTMTKPEFWFAYKEDKECWIIFPWENQETEEDYSQ